MPSLANILVVDDEDIVCQSCRRVLTAEGHQVSTALTGTEALAKISSENFDVALVDLRIPGSGGLHLLRVMRRASPQTEVVVITGYPSLENAKGAIQFGAYDYVTKPLAPHTLRAVVSQVLTHKPWRIRKRCSHGPS